MPARATDARQRDVDRGKSAEVVVGPNLEGPNLKCVVGRSLSRKSVAEGEQQGSQVSTSPPRRKDRKSRL